MVLKEGILKPRRRLAAGVSTIIKADYNCSEKRRTQRVRISDVPDQDWWEALWWQWGNWEGTLEKFLIIPILFFLEEMIIMTKTRMSKLNKVAKLRKRHLCLFWEAKQARPLTMTPNQWDNTLFLNSFKVRGTKKNTDTSVMVTKQEKIILNRYTDIVGKRQI